MASYISIAFVYSYDDKNHVADDIHLISTLMKFNFKFVLNYPENNYENWEIKLFDSFDELLNSDYLHWLESDPMAHIIVQSATKHPVEIAQISIADTINDFYGVLIEIEESILLPKITRSAVSKVMYDISHCFYRLHNLHFSYAFCDNEVEISYSPNEINYMKNPYSILCKY